MPKPTDYAVDGFTWRDIRVMQRRPMVDARCARCYRVVRVEPTAKSLTCPLCGAEHAVTSPLIKLDLIGL